jgi:hypothetical protein
MFAQFLTFRRSLACGAKAKRSSPPFPPSSTSSKETPSTKEQKTKQASSQIFSLQNCSVAIQDVLEPESIPLPQSELESYSSAASSMQANQPATMSDRPATATLGTADPNTTSSTGVEEPGAEGGTTASAGMGTSTDGVGTPAGTQSANGTGTSNGSGTSKQPSIATATGTGYRAQVRRRKVMQLGSMRIT